MKITLFLLLLVIFQVYSGNCYSQNARVSIQNARLRVGQVLEQIESQTEYLFVYNKQNVDVRRTVDINASNQTVSEVLDQMFKGTDIKYVMEGKNIVLTKNSRSAEDKTDTLQEMAIVRGKVTDSKGEPIIGANILEKGTANGVITNTEGEFSMNIPPYATIVVSYISYEPQTIALNGRNNLHIRMEEKNLALEQVVVTAMGIQKKMSSLTYSTQQISSNELTRAKEPNMINTLAGKTAGVQINKTANLGGSAKVVIRGARSAFASGNNQPLYVIDGVPMLNSSTESTSTVIGGNYDGLNRDAGDGISNLNPDDIESINILKGSSAAALYGSQAANGVILITTKKGKAGLQRVTFSSNLTVSHAISTPEFQNTYGRNEDGGTASWGTKGNVTDYDNIGEFFSNGITTFNSLAITTGNEKVQTYFSYANTNLNPDDIESINILKGSSAAALYGSQAANGVILITTKKGKAGLQRVTFSSNLTVSHAISTPEFQNTYGRNEDGGTASWGTKGNVTDYDNIGEFFSNGITTFNSLAITTGNEKVQTYFSYANTTAKGIVDNNKLQKNNLNLHETASLFNNKLKLDGIATLMTQTVKNSPATGGYYLNPLVSLYSFPRGVDMSTYRENFETWNADRNMMTQNWIEKNGDGTVSEWGQNPYWLKNRVLSGYKRYRAVASARANLHITDYFSLQVRGNVDYISDKFDNKMYATTAPNIAGKYEDKENGRYIWSDSQEIQVYGDAMVLFNKEFDDFSLNTALGASINMSKVNSLTIDSRLASLYKPNVFTVPNVVMDSKAAVNQSIDSKRTLQSVFATMQWGWKGLLYLDITARNDWSSTLAHTDSKNTGFFYPSIGATWILNKTCSLPKWISFAKVRASWAEVGNDLPIGITNPVDIIMVGGSINVNTVEQRGDLKPEISSSIEFGTEWRFFHHRFGIDFTWYQTNTKNQLLRMDNPTGSTYKYRYVNAGKIRNQGFELTVDATPLLYRNFSWKSLINMSANKNKVVTLHPDYPEFSYYEEGFNAGYQMRVKEGGSLGDIYGNAFRRNEDGSIMVDETSKRPLGNTGNKDLLGNANPDFTMGWSNTLTYKNLELYFLIDFRFGGEVMSLTQSELDANGVTKVTEDARTRGYVEYQGQKFNDPRAFYSAVGGRNAISEYYMYDATCIRLREVSLSYSFPKTILENSRFIKGIDVSLAARNLCFLKKEAPFDPDAVMSVGNNNQGVDVFGMPTTRNIGFNLRLTF